eukprot:g15552.t1
MATTAPLLQNDTLPQASAGAAIALELGILHEGFSPDSRISKGDQRVSMAPDVAEQLIKDGYGDSQLQRVALDSIFLKTEAIGLGIKLKLQRTAQLYPLAWKVIVEKGAGVYSGFSDQAFVQKGCRIADRAEVIRKSSEPWP